MIRRSRPRRAATAVALFAAAALLAVAGRDAAAAGPGPGDVATRLQVLDARRAALGPFHASFTYRVESALFTAARQRSGTFYYDPARGLVLAYERPERYAVLVDGDRVRMIAPARPAESLDLRADPVFAGMNRLVAHDFTALSRYFEVTAANGAGGDWILRLVPRRGKALREIHVVVDPATALLRSIAIEGAGGDRQELDFGEHRPGAVPPAVFTPEYWTARLDGAAAADDSNNAAPAARPGAVP